MYRLATFIHKDQLKRVQSQIFNFVCRSQGDNFHIILYLNFAKYTMSGFIGSGSKRKNVFSFSFDCDAA